MAVRAFFDLAGATEGERKSIAERAKLNGKLSEADRLWEENAELRPAACAAAGAYVNRVHRRVAKVT